MLLAISLLANLIMITTLWVFAYRAKKRLIYEKMATYAGCLGAITNSLGREDKGEQIQLLATGLSAARGGIAKDALTPLLSQASLVSLFREKKAVDAGGEYVRLLGYEVIPAHPEADEAIEYILAMIEQQDTAAQEPRDRFSDECLTSAQMQIERKITSYYAGSLNSISLFK